MWFGVSCCKLTPGFVSSCRLHCPLAHAHDVSDLPVKQHPKQHPKPYQQDTVRIRCSDNAATEPGPEVKPIPAAWSGSGGSITNGADADGINLAHWRHVLKLLCKLPISTLDGARRL